MHKKAVCVGINYLRTPNELRGCINDADEWAKFLSAAGFESTILAEKQATRSNILQALRNLVAEIHPGDVAAFTYSGHGTWIPDTNGDESDGRDECLCPIDMGRDGHNLIVDDELGEIFGKIPAGGRLLFASDSCHSGTILKELLDEDEPRPRCIPPDRFIDSPKLKARAARLAKIKRPMTRKETLPGVVLFSGCRDSETSSDANLGGRACGAFSHFALPAFAKVLAARGSYNDVYTSIKKSLPSRMFQQSPQFVAEAADMRALLF